MPYLELLSYWDCNEVKSIAWIYDKDSLECFPVTLIWKL